MILSEIAAEYCSKIIEININNVPNNYDKQKALNTARSQLTGITLAIDISDDKKLHNHLFDIYKYSLENDKYGISS